MILSPEDLERCAEIRKPQERILKIASEVGQATGVDPARIASNCRRHKVAVARDVVCFIARREGFSNSQIGAALAGRDPSTIQQAIERETARRIGR